MVIDRLLYLSCFFLSIMEFILQIISERMAIDVIVIVINTVVLNAQKTQAKSTTQLLLSVRLPESILPL